MKQTKRLISQLELQYGNNQLGLASQVGYLTGVLKAIEEAIEGTGEFIEDHTDHLVQAEKEQALIGGGVPAEQTVDAST